MEITRAQIILALAQLPEFLGITEWQENGRKQIICAYCDNNVLEPSLAAVGITLEQYCEGTEEERCAWEQQADDWAEALQELTGFSYLNQPKKALDKALDLLT